MPADGATANYNFVLPEVGASPDSWGSKLNANWASLDGILFNNGVDPGGGGGTTVGSLPLAGGTLTGPLMLQNNPPSTAGNMTIGYAGGLPGFGFDSQRNISIGAAGNMNFVGPGGVMGHFDTTNGDFYGIHNLCADNSPGTFIGLNSAGQTTVSWDANHYVYIGPGGAWNFMLNGSLCANLSTDFTITTGTGWKPGGGVWASYSDARIKDVVGPYERTLRDLLMLEPKRFTYKDKSDREYVGLIAQEVEDHWPQRVSQRDGYVAGKLVPDMRALDASEILYAVINGMQELHRRLRALEAR